MPTPGEASDTFIKRLVGLPGDTIKIVGGPVIRTAQCEADSYVAVCGDAPDCHYPRAIHVPPDHCFMMGDNRGNSDDSRHWGPTPRGSIIGEAFAAYWPPDRIGPL